MFDLGGSVLIEDEFLRDGLQNEQRVFTVNEKLEYLRAIELAGVRRIQIGSFVHPRRVPQMANTDELADRLQHRPGVTYTALVLNDVGLQRAIDVRLKHLSISISASQAHSQRNLNASIEEALERILPVIERALEEGIVVRAGVQCALGCAFEGRVDPQRVLAISRRFVGLGVQEVNIADTAGLANPRQVYRLCRLLHDVLPHTSFSLHLHDTRGLGLANLVAGLQAGVRVFDASIGGLGGCPFVPDAAGNIATEDAAFLCNELGLATGIDWTGFGKAVAMAEEALGRTLPGKATHVPLPAWLGRVVA